MSAPTTAGIIEHFSMLVDPRTHVNKNEHKLIDIIVRLIMGFKLPVPSS